MTRISKRKNVFVTDSMAGLIALSGVDVLEPLRRDYACRIWSGRQRPSTLDLRRELADCQGLFCLITDPIDAECIEAAGSLQVISSCSVGVDHIDLQAATRSGIWVGHTPGVLTETTADLAFALLLSTGRRVAESDRAVRAGSWTPAQRWEIDGFVGHDLHGATLGIIGLGRIGQAVARRATGFGMRVLAWSRTPRQGREFEWVELEELLAQSDFVSLHLAQTPETLGFLDAEKLARFKDGAILVNTARGGIVVEEALVAALGQGKLAGAGLDVFASEPLAADHPLLNFPNVVVTPHIGSASVKTRVEMANLAVANLIAGLEGRSLPFCANEIELGSSR